MRVVDVLVIGFMIAAVLILGRVIWGTPLITRVRESFASGGKSPINSSTDCPMGSAFYMYKGSSFCCSGNMNTGADRLEDTCKAYTGRDAQPLTFCTLGPSKGAIKNCMELRSGLMQAEGAAVCPSNHTFVKGASGSDTQGGRCCDDPGNPELTECVSNNYCNVSTNKNEFADAKSCQFQKAQEDAPACPKGYGPFTAAGQGFPGGSAITLFGCTDNGQNCYADSTIKRLKELGYDVSSLTSCTSLSKLTTK
jgi:hypothetical protein